MKIKKVNFTDFVSETGIGAGNDIDIGAGYDVDTGMITAATHNRNEI